MLVHCWACTMVLTWGVAGRASTIGAELLNGSHKHNVDSNNGDQGQRVGNNAPRCREVVEQAAVEHLGAGLEVGPADDGGTVRLQTLGNDDAGRSEHRPASVQQLVGAVLGEVGLVLAQAKGIIAVAANKMRQISVPECTRIRTRIICDR